MINGTNYSEGTFTYNINVFGLFLTDLATLFGLSYTIGCAVNDAVYLCMIPWKYAPYR